MSLTEHLPAPAGPARTGHGRLPRLLAAATVAPLIRWIVAADSVPGGTQRRTACDECGTSIGLAGPLRALSPLARCGTCRHRIGAPPATVELALLVSVGVLVVAARPVSETVAFAWWALCVLPLFFVDLAVHRLPDRLTYPAAFGTWGLLGLAALLGGTETAGGGTAWLRSLLAGLAVAFVFAASTVLLGRRGFGLGDAKLALSSAAVLGWFGWELVFFGLMVSFVAAALTSVALLLAGRVRWSGHLPFGPFLILGSLVTLALA
ncbi:A24 family peptidase [Micromonospora sp. NPDC049523]|uniref:prepilin peptidase n=1 Tax=Micromonospora sp. NPDC049523 TaxID=3155921 RepID=UPI003420D78F